MAEKKIEFVEEKPQESLSDMEARLVSLSKELAAEEERLRRERMDRENEKRFIEAQAKAKIDHERLSHAHFSRLTELVNKLNFGDRLSDPLFVAYVFVEWGGLLRMESQQINELAYHVRILCEKFDELKNK